MKIIIKCVVCVAILLVVSSCNTSLSSTTSYIEVISKKMDSKNNCFIEVKNPYDKSSESFNITINDENLWNLIKEGQIYLSDYEYKDINKKVKLISIKYPAEPK